MPVLYRNSKCDEAKSKYNDARKQLEEMWHYAAARVGLVLLAMLFVFAASIFWYAYRFTTAGFEWGSALLMMMYTAAALVSVHFGWICIRICVGLYKLIREKDAVFHDETAVSTWLTDGDKQATWLEEMRVHYRPILVRNQQYLFAAIVAPAVISYITALF